jgi:DNA-binding NtrC family response regulator
MSVSPELPMPFTFCPSAEARASQGLTPKTCVGETAIRPEEKKQKGKRVLVMDDESSILEMTGRMLGSQGYEVETAIDGDTAVAQYRAAMDAENPFDLVIMDLTVPSGMNGFDAFKAIQAFDPGVKVILSTGYAHEPVVVNFKEYGIAGVAPKPYRVMDLLGTVAGVLNGS